MVLQNKLLKLVIKTINLALIGTIVLSAGISGVNKYTKDKNESFKSSENLIKEIKLKSSRITTKNQLISDLKIFNPNLDNNNPVIYALDSDNDIIENRHGSNTIETIYGLIKDKDIKERNISYISFLLSSNRFNLKDELKNKKLIYNNLKDDNEKQKFKDNNLEFDLFDFYKLAYEKTPNNPVIINQSFAFNPNSKEKVFNSTESIEFIQNVNTYNSNLINALKEYKNLYLSTSAGNNNFHYTPIVSNNIDDYNNKLLYFSNQDFTKYKILSNELNNFITKITILNDTNIEILNKKLHKNNINIELNNLKELINDSILDYIQNFEKNDLVNQLNLLTYDDYKNLKGRIMIIESISLLKFRENINQQINLLDKIPKEILEFYNKINILDLNNFHLNKEQIAEFQEIIDKYSKDYPELFLINNYGSNSNLENRIKSNFIEIAPLYPNTNSSFILGYSGTSSGAAIITAKTTNKLMEEKEIKLENGINR